MLKHVNDVYRLDSLYVTVGMWYEFVPNNNTFEELRSSGNLQLIKNDSIKNILLDLNKENEELVSSREHMRREYDFYLYDEKAKMISFLDVNDPDKINSIIDWYYPRRQSVAENKTTIQQNYRTLFNNTTFINGLALAAGNNRWITEDHYETMLDYSNKLIRLIDLDLKTDEE